MSWDGIYARLSCATGWTFEYIDEYMTLPRLQGFAEYWKEAPPVNELAAAYIRAMGASGNSGAVPPGLGF